VACQMRQPLTLLALFSVLFLISCTIQTFPAAAEPTQIIHIKPDGTVTPATAPLQIDGSTYKFTTNIDNASLVIERSNIVLDGQGFTLQGSGYLNNQAAINLTSSNVTVKNLRITGWQIGILGFFDGNRIVNNDFEENCFDIAVYASNYQITQNYLSYCRIKGNNITVSQNQITVGDYCTALWISSGTGIIIEANDITVANMTTSFISTDGGNFQVYHNNFLNAQDMQESRGQFFLFGGGGPFAATTPWDNGYPSGGNYWSDYTQRYSVSEIDHSGIGDTAYVTATNKDLVDRYPLLKPYNTSIPTLPTPPPPQTISSNPNETTPSTPELPIWAIIVFAVIALFLTIAIRKKTTVRPMGTCGV